MKRLSLSVVIILFVCAATGALGQDQAAATPSCADLHLVPAPRECTAVESIPVGTSGLSVVSTSNDEDRFAAGDLEHAIADGVVVGSGRPIVITLLRADSPSAKAILVRASSRVRSGHARRRLRPRLAKNSLWRDLSIIGETAAGIFYGAQTLKQLIEPSTKRQR